MNEYKSPVMAALNQHELGLFDKADSDIYWTRLAARAVLLNDKNRIAVMNFTKTGFYKLPGGGIDDGEEIIAALRREIEEETGYLIESIEKLGIVKEDRYFCGMHQTSFCFTANVSDFVGTKPTKKESDEGMNLQWADSIDEAIAWIENGSLTDEDGSQIGLEMMKLRDISILRALRSS